MCLGIPGKLLEIHDRDSLPMGTVEFGGIAKEICLAYVPDAKVGEFVLVHVGFAISKIDEDEAQQIFEYIKEMGELAEIEAAGPSEPLPASKPDSEKAP